MVNRSDRPQKTAMLIAKRIVADVNRSGFQVGDRLPPEKIMLDDYQVGRGTLRESLRYLELSGVLSMKPGPRGGPTLENPDASHLMNTLALLLQFNGAPLRSVVETRVVVEPLMSRFAAARSDDEQRRRLTDSVQRMGKNLSELDVFLETNQEFHDLVAWASNNPLLGFIVEALDGIYEVFATGIEYPTRRRSKVFKAHSAILGAILDNDPDSAEKAMRDHVVEMAEYLEAQSPEALSKTISWQDMR